MTEQEFRGGLDRLQREYYDKRWNLIKKYAEETNRYKVGMILHGQGQIIRVEKVRVLHPGKDGLPYHVYIGPLLTKKLRPRKDGRWGEIFQGAVQQVLAGKEEVENG